jgi:hypothetical protein
VRRLASSVNGGEAIWRKAILLLMILMLHSARWASFGVLALVGVAGNASAQTPSGEFLGATPAGQQWKFESPLRVCTASIQDFGARCAGAVVPEFDEPLKPIGTADPGGACVSSDFCGYDVDVWKYAPRAFVLLAPVTNDRLALVGYHKAM